MSPKKPEWMQIAEDDNSSSNVRKVDKRLTIGTLATVGAIVIAGSLFANASDEPSALADVTSTSSPATSAAEPSTSTSSDPATVTAPTAASRPVPKKIESPSIAQMPKGGRDDEDGDHEGRERGEGRGEHRDRYEGHEYGDDD